MLAGALPVVFNESFREHLGIHADLLLIKQDDPKSVAETLLRIKDLSLEERVIVQKDLHVYATGAFSIEKLVNSFSYSVALPFSHKKEKP